MKVLTAYIKQHKRTAAFYFIAMAVFFVLLFFYRLPPAAWAYGAVLCLFFGLVLAVPDYLRFRKKHRELRQMGEQQEITGAELLPVPEGLLEQDYQDLIPSGTGLSGSDRQTLGKGERYPGQAKPPVPGYERLLYHVGPPGENPYCRIKAEPGK